jgi:hypothetical protein
LILFHRPCVNLLPKNYHSFPVLSVIRQVGQFPHDSFISSIQSKVTLSLNGVIQMPPICRDKYAEVTTDRTQQLLESARQKLLRNDVPPLLRVTAFLRISCLAVDEPGAYAKLMQQLCSHQAWWTTCTASSDGTLKSSNPEINLLLASINRLHQPQTLSLAAQINPFHHHSLMAFEDSGVAPRRISS